MPLDSSMFTGRKLNLYAYEARSFDPVDVDLLPGEAVTLLRRIDRVAERAAHEEDLAYVGYAERVSRLGWESPVTGVVVLVCPSGVVWSFTAAGEDGVERHETNELARADLLRALLRTAHPERFGRRFREFAEERPSEALPVLDEWLTCTASDRMRGFTLPLSRRDLLPLLKSADPDIRSGAMKAVARLEAAALAQEDASAA